MGVFRNLQSEQIHIALVEHLNHLERIGTHFHSYADAQMFGKIAGKRILQAKALALVFKVGVRSAKRGDDKFTGIDDTVDMRSIRFVFLHECTVGFQRSIFRLRLAPAHQKQGTEDTEREGETA